MASCKIDRGNHFLFGSVFIKKNNQTKFFFLKNRNRTETGSNQPVSVWFGFLGQKPVQTGLARFSQFWLVFLVLARFFLVWLGFSSFGSVWLGFFTGFFRFRFGSVFSAFGL
jgi:hypothetical protein